ncbi:MAG TPA: FAD-dependent oxidoreductase [Ilumatobacter sp.]|nr:FAD-dependent oxidoreductase [Ilumatobacter sp.]
MIDTSDVAVIGAGPAGLAAAVAAAEAGLRVALIDAGLQPGGQYWRHPDERHPTDDEAHGHHGWKTFASLRARLHDQRHAGTIDYRTRTQVWFIDKPRTADEPWTLHTNGATDGEPAHPSGRTVRATRLILCPGGYDRQLPIPGWDLPGAMAAGGVQALLKGNRTLAGRRAIVAGTGPFLLPVAAGLADAGVDVVAICEAGNLLGWVKNVLGTVQVPSKGLEGAGYAAALVRRRIAYKPRAAITRIDGVDEVESVTVSRVTRDGHISPNTARTYAVDLVALGWGFTPSLELVVAVGAETRLDVDESLVAVVDDRQRSSVDRVYVAGEATGVGGAVMAVAEGELAGLTAASDTGRQVKPGRIRKLQGIRRRSAAFAKAMHLAHPIPAHWQDWLNEDTTVCRCEEVSYGQICTARRDLGAQDARTVKLLARPGMGWCQGRICGFTTAKIIAEQEERRLEASDLRAASNRSLAVPVLLNDLAQPDD